MIFLFFAAIVIALAAGLAASVGAVHRAQATLDPSAPIGRILDVRDTESGLAVDIEWNHWSAWQRDGQVEGVSIEWRDAAIETLLGWNPAEGLTDAEIEARILARQGDIRRIGQS